MMLFTHKFYIILDIYGKHMQRKKKTLGSRGNIDKLRTINKIIIINVN